MPAGNVVRWRWGIDEQGNRVKESNARIVKWSDGTTQLMIGNRVAFDVVGSLEQILRGPSTVPDGTMNLVGALRKAMATTGYTEVKEFQRVEVVAE